MEQDDPNTFYDLDLVIILERARIKGNFILFLVGGRSKKEENRVK